MAKEAVLQVRMDADMKEKAEKLYKDMGTSLAEAVRIFTAQSIKENGMPFMIKADRGSTYGRLSEYANKELIEKEEGVLEAELIKKYENSY